MLLKMTWKYLSRVVLDLLNQVVNVDAMWSFHNRIRYSLDFEIDFLLVGCKVELVRVRWCSVTIFGRNKFFHCVCVCVRFHRFPVSSWTWITRMFSDSFTSFIVLSEKRSSFFVNVHHRSFVNGTFFLSPPKKRSVSSGFPDRSQIGLGLDWVGWESLTRGVSLNDCWTSFPTGCCSTVKPNWSFPLLQLRSCFNEIFGGGRGNKYGLSYETSPVFNFLTFGIQ